MSVGFGSVERAGVCDRAQIEYGTALFSLRSILAGSALSSRASASVYSVALPGARSAAPKSARISVPMLSRKLRNALASEPMNSV